MTVKNIKRDLGEAYVVRILQRERSMSQNDIAARCGLSASGVSRIVDRLKNKNLIKIRKKKNAKATKTPGRPTVQLCLNASARQVIVVYISLKKIRYFRLAFDWTVTQLEEHDKPRCMDISELVEEVCSTLEKIRDRDDAASFGKICGYSILVSGFTNGQSGMIFDSSTVKVPGTGFKLRDAISSRMDHPVSLDSEGNAALLGEIACGAVSDWNRDAVYIYYDENGTVVSFYLNGKIYRGSPEAVPGQISCYAYEEPEPGHCRESRAYWLPPVGLSVEERETLVASGLPDYITKFGEVVKYQDQLTGAASEILHSRLRLLGRGLCNIINLLNPDEFFAYSHSTAA